MPRFASESPVRVRVGDCSCPGAPHQAGDFVVLRRALSIEGGAAAIDAVSVGGGDAAVAAAILPHMIESWDFLDAETGEPLEVTPDSVAEALPWNYGGKEVVNALSEALAAPLSSSPSEKTTLKPLDSTPTASTSRKARSSSTRQPRSA